MNFAAALTRANRRVLNVFGSTVILDDQEIRAEFLRPSGDAMLDGITAVVDRPQIIVQDSDVPRNPVGKRVIVGAPHFDVEVVYTVADARPDGFGMTTLLLEFDV